jgi:hypothetical protein
LNLYRFTEVLYVPHIQAVEGSGNPLRYDHLVIYERKAARAIII